MIANYAKTFYEFSTRIIFKIRAFTMIQNLNNFVLIVNEKKVNLS
jgi:hypothetical protein